MSDVGCVYLVGGGPGDPELLTIKAQRLLTEAGAVVYDRLVSPEILDLVPKGATRIFVGKAGRHHNMPQDEICELLASLARSGRKVVRLKGGDPFIFGRGSEEALHLARQGIRFEIVPGVTAAAAVGASLGVPLTHRGLATGVRFVTAHKRTDGELDLDFTRLADPKTTLVFYMGLKTLSDLVGRLIEAGHKPGTPAAAIARGTVDGQRQVVTTLARLPVAVARAGLESPVIFIVGPVVDLATTLNWQNLVHEGAEPGDEEETETKQGDSGDGKTPEKEHSASA